MAGPTTTPTNYWYTNVASVQAGGVNILANLDDPNLSSGRVSLITATYTMTGNELANDAVYIARIPSGALVNPITGNIAAKATVAGSVCTLSVGDTDTLGGTQAYDPARYSSALNVQAGNSTVGFAFSGGTTVNNPVEVTDDWIWLIGTFATLNAPTPGTLVTFRIQITQLD